MVRIIIFIVAGIAFVYVATTKISTLPLSNVQPDSKIYFLDNLVERIKLLTIKDPNEKLGKLLEYSDEKLNEINYIIDSEENRKLLEKVLPKHEQYIEEALDEILKLKEDAAESASADGTGSLTPSASAGQTSWESEISEQVLEKKEILSGVQGEIDEEDKEKIEEEIKKTDVVIQKIIEQAEGPIKEIIIYKTANIDESIEDKQEEKATQEEEKEKEALSETEKLYYIWIDSAYAKTLPKKNEPFFVRVHVRRRDNECKFFGGKLVLFINDEKWESSIPQMQPSDDAWRDIGEIELSDGNYNAKIRLLDNSGRIISTKNFGIVVD